MNDRTRIKICGFTKEEDVKAAVQLGVDALGFVFYAPSSRYVTPHQARELLQAIPPFVTSVGLFVNPTLEEVKQVLETAPVSLLQFHGDESPEFCAEVANAVRRPFMKVGRMKVDMSHDVLLQYEKTYRAASSYFSGLLLDAFVDGYGGAGKVFDWSLIPKNLGHQVVLSGGLNAQNVTKAVEQIRPYAVDVSSGVEKSKGIKDSDLMREFVQAVKQVNIDGDRNR